jgi:hypothetical protein
MWSPASPVHDAYVNTCTIVHACSKSLVHVPWSLLAIALVGCATSAELGLLQHAPGDGTGGSLTGHWGTGLVGDHIVAVAVDVRGDIAASGDRFAVGASVLGGLPIGRYQVLARGGLWRAAFSNTAERAVVPTLELAGYVPWNDSPTVPKHPEFGWSSAGVVFGVREDLDAAAYTTIFVGIALFTFPGY